MRRHAEFPVFALVLVLCALAMGPRTTVDAAWSGSVQAPRIQQIRGLACEAAALQIALSAKGINVSQDWILNSVGADLRAPVMGGDGYPVVWGDPYTTFVGNVNLAMGRGGYGVYQQPIINAARAAGATAWGGDGWRPADLYEQIAAGNPVVVWVPWSLEPVIVRTMRTWSGQDVWFSRQEHAQTLIGFDRGANTVTLSDPLTASIRTFPMPLFEQRFAQFHGQAVVVARQYSVPPPEHPSTSVAAVRGADDQMYAHSDAGGWTGLGGHLTATPAVVRQVDGTPLYIAIGDDHQLWARTDVMPWNLLAPPGQVWCRGSPAAAVSGTTLAVGCSGHDAALYVARATLVPGAQPALAGWEDLGGSLWDGPAVAFINGALTVAANDPAGHLMYRTESGGWEPTGFWCVGHPALAVNGAAVLLACEGTDEQGWYGLGTDALPATATPLGGQLIDGVGAAASGATGFEVDVTGDDLQLYFTHVEPAGAEGWRAANGRLIGGVSAA